MELKKKKLDYNPYEDDEFDEYGNVSPHYPAIYCINIVTTCMQYQPKDILKKYNEEIDGVKKDSIVLGE